MGLFTKKDPCAVCGGKVTGLFPHKIDGMLICGDCYGTVDLPQGAEKNMTVEDFKQYMAFREENGQLKQRFKTTHQVDFGWLDDKFLFDMENRLLCMDKHLDKTIFEGGQITSFEIREDEQLLFCGSAKELLRYTSTVPQRAMAIAPQLEMYRMQAQMRREMERERERMKEQNGDSVYYSQPDIDIPEPFRMFYVDIYFEHPFWNVYTADMRAPEFDNENPDINDYLNCYNNAVKMMEELARSLMEVAFPGAPERTAAAAGGVTMAGSGVVSAPGVAVDTAAEIERFKDLMDKGILTEEEFTAKKRQLLGI